MRQRETREDPAHYNHSLLMPKRLSSLSGIGCCSLTPLVLLNSQQASTAPVLGNLEPVRPDQPGVSFTTWVKAVLGSTDLAINPSKLSAQELH